LSILRTLLFLLVLALVAGFYYVKVHHPPAANPKIAFTPEPTPVTVLSLKSEDRLDRLSIHHLSQQSRIVFQRETGNRWNIVQPVVYPSESLIVNGMESLLKMMPRIRPLSAEGISPADFGFDHPQFSICVTSSGRQAERCLVIGSEAAIGEGSYAKWEDEETYFRVNQPFVNAFDRSLYSVRKKQIFNLLEENLISLRFRTASEDILLKREDKRWMLEKPARAMIGSSAMHSVLADLNGLFVREFLDGESVGDPKFGLKPAQCVIGAVFENGTRETLIQGSPASGKNAYYVRTDDDRETVSLVSKKKLDEIHQAFKTLAA